MRFDRGLLPKRAVELLVTPTTGRTRRRGSGYLVSPGRVLTAAHVLEGAAKVEVRFRDDQAGELTVAAAVEWRHTRIDIAVLVVPVRAGEPEAGMVTVSFGRVGERDLVLDCTALGFPRFKVRTDTDGSRFRDAEHVDATCAVLSNWREGTLDLKVASPPADDPDPCRDAWEGMSGAAVFCDGHLVGVVTRHHRTDGPGRIAASRVDRWAEALSRSELAGLERLLGRQMTPAELPDVGRAIPPGTPPGDLGSLDGVGGPLGHDRSAHLLPGPAVVPLAVPQRRVAPDRLRGRDGLVKELTDAVTRRAAGDAAVPGVWLLSGMGGCGKTTVALETAHRLAGAATRVWWVSGEDEEGLSAALRAVAFSAGARASDFAGAHPADVLWRCLDALTTPWLLVLDNVDDPSALAAAPFRTAEGVGWLRPPARACGAVLITSRESRGERWGHWVHMVGVGLLDRPDGAKVLHDLAPPAGREEEAEELAEHLGGLPLVLNLAGSYLARALEDPWPSPSTPQTFADYRRSLDASLADMTSDPDVDLGPVERSRRALLSTWELSLDLLHRQGTDLARPLLRLLSALGPARIPYRELLDPELLAGSDLFTHPTRPRLQSALKGLAGLQLITIEMTRDSVGASAGGPLRWITIHPMVRAASRAHADFTAQAPLLLDLVTALLQRFTGPLETFDPGDWPLWQAIAPHCAAVPALLPDDDRAEPSLVAAATEPAVRTAEYHNYLGMYGEAIAELDTLGAIRARLLGDEHPATIATRLQLAWAHRHNGALTEADRLYQDVAQACERALPDGHPYLQSAKTGRARVLRELGRYETAEEELRAALAMRLRARTVPRGILRIRHDLATLAYRRGRYEEAVVELRDVSRQFTELAGEGDLDTLATGVSLARALREAGQAREAEDVAENVVRGYLTVLGPEHPDVVMARHERARLIRDHESDPECLNRARDEFADIWQLNERRLGPDHPDTIAARHELATTWHLLGRHELAAEHYEAVLEAGKRRLGEHHPNVARCARNLTRVRAELVERGASPPGGEAEPDGCDAELQGGSPMDDRAGDQDALASATLDLTGLSLEEALSRRTHPAAARLLARYVRPRVSRGGDDPGSGGFSEVRHVPRKSDAKSARQSVSYTPASHHGVRRDIQEYTPWSPFPSPADARALATGEVDRVLAERLQGQQRGVRALVLDELLNLAGAVTSDRTGEVPMISEVRSLLVRAERADPEAAAAVLLHPSVGRWLSRALRALHTPPGGPYTWSGTLSADLLHLHSVAAAAALRARLLFALPLPVRDGYVYLPGLGAADLRVTGATTADVVSTGDSAVITTGDVEVRLPSRSDPRPEGWIPVHRVRTPVGERHFDLSLEDMDPYRETDGPAPPNPLGPVEVTRWRRTIRDAGELLADADPQQAEALAVALTALTPLPKSNASMMTSVSSSDAFGGAVLSTPADAVELAVTLVHELRHMELNAVLDSLDLYDDESEGPEEKLYYAPWRDDPRPLPSLFHGVFAFFGVVDFWQKLAQRAVDERLRRRALFQLVYWRTQTRDAYEALCSSPRLTAAGEEFTARMGDSTATWARGVAVPDDVAALALEAVVAHRTRWRLHHVRPGSGSVAELAEAWASGVPCPPWRHLTGRLVPDPAVPSLNDHTALLCRAAADPSLIHRAHTEPGQQEFDPADLTRLLGETDSACRLATDQVTRWPQRHEPWARLELALRETVLTSPGDSGTAAAARSLAHRPEAVRAVHAHVAAVTGTSPDPVALAAWLGDPTGPAELPDLPPIHPL